jgi:signal transduction histidine kinase/ActR/RegA family two-component response regulator
VSSTSAVDRTPAVVVWAPRGRDAVLAVHLIERHGMRAILCRNVDELISQITEAGCALITSEVLGAPVRELLGTALAAQPPWSDFPIILLGPRGVDREDEALTAIKVLGNVTILERPLHSGTLIGAVVAALRGRRRQFEAREAIFRRDQFLAMLGHELRNPLAAIMLAMETLPPANGSQPGDKQRRIVERQTRHLARLVDDLLDVARVTSGKVQLQTEPLELSEVVERCLQGAELAAHTRHIELRAELAPSALIIDGDLVRLEEIFNNLIGNAIKYSAVGARVTLRTRREGPRSIVEITDTGIGMAPNMIGRVFDLFAQADASLERSQGGLGIGLTLVRSLVELHGGTITARSAGLGHGSTFVVELPLARSAGPTQPQLTVVHETRPVKVVLVEDNHDLLDMTTELLEVAGCEVGAASDGAVGLELLLATAPDVAFIDIGLPTLDGYAIARQARERGVTSFLVAMTGYGQPDDRERALAAGFDRHMTKPVTSEALKASLRDAEQARRGASRPHRARS